MDEAKGNVFQHIAPAVSNSINFIHIIDSRILICSSFHIQTADLLVVNWALDDKICVAASVRYCELLPHNHLLTHWRLFCRIINSIFHICAVRLQLFNIFWRDIFQQTRTQSLFHWWWTLGHWPHQRHFSSHEWRTFKWKDKNDVWLVL